MALAHLERLLERVALGGHRRDLVDVGKHSLGKRVHVLRLDPGVVAGPSQPTPSHARARAVGTEQRVERAAAARLAATEGEVHVVAGELRLVAAGHELEKALKGLLHAHAHVAVEPALVGGHGRLHGVDDLLHQTR